MDTQAQAMADLDIIKGIFGEERHPGPEPKIRGEKENLAEELYYAGYTNRYIAKKLGVSHTIVNDWVKRRVNKGTLPKIGRERVGGYNAIMDEHGDYRYIDAVGFLNLHYGEGGIGL